MLFDTWISVAVISTLFNFVKMFKQSHEENCKQLEFEKKKAEKEAAAELMKMNASDTGHLLQSQVKSVNWLEPKSDWSSSVDGNGWNDHFWN